MEKKEVIKILKKPTWEVGEKYAVKHRVPYSDVVFDMEIAYEKAPYCPDSP